MNTFRYISLAVALGITLGAAAQKVNKVSAMKKQSGKSVLKATDSRLPANLVYFDGEVSMESMPQEVKDFFASYEEAAARISAGEAPASVLSLSPGATTDSVGPILGDIQFDQGAPYNNRCPYLNQGRAITGCVATAMAQIMTFHRYPAVGTGSATYTGTGGASTYIFADHPFDWDNILHDYSAVSYTATQANAVAELMLACGASVNMNYNTNESGANSDKVRPALRDVFGYDQSIEYLHDASDEIIANVWTVRLKREFNAGRPVYYAGANQTSGHAFVLDGYKVENGVTYFHVNWGWSGAYNGWYLINRLRPVDVNYSTYSNDFIYNIFPPGAGLEDVKDNEATKLNMDQPVYTILGSKIPASDMQKGCIYIQNGHKFVW